MTGPTSGTRSLGGELVQLYEDMRDTGRSLGPARWGRALLQDRGMAAWMQAWASASPTLKSPPRPNARAATGVRGPPDFCPTWLETDQDQMVNVLAGMALEIFRS